MADEKIYQTWSLLTHANPIWAQRIAKKREVFTHWLTGPPRLTNAFVQKIRSIQLIEKSQPCSRAGFFFSQDGELPTCYAVRTSSQFY